VDTLVDLFKKPRAIVLFGSFAKGEDTEESDIDILVITSNKRNAEVDRFLYLCEKEFNRHVNIMVMETLDKTESAFKNSIANGIVLYGYVKVV
jgi:predicted nucleotidyltransferase